MNRDRLLDEVDWKILDELQRNARISFSELGRRVNLSTPAVRARVAHLEEEGVITGYHAIVEPKKVGYTISALLRITISGGEHMARKLAAELLELPEVRECHRSTGDQDFILKIDTQSVTTLEHLIDRLTEFGITSTSIVLSSPIRNGILLRPDPSDSEKAEDYQRG